MNEEKMEIPRLGSFDKEYGRKNGKLMLPQSLWTETNKEHIDTKSLTGKAETEVAIIGGGITGLADSFPAEHCALEISFNRYQRVYRKSLAEIETNAGTGDKLHYRDRTVAR